MTSQIFRIKEHFKGLGFQASDIRARVVKNKYGENIDTSIRLNSKGGRMLMDRIFRHAPQLAKIGYNIRITFYEGELIHITITEASYGKKGRIDYGQAWIMIGKYIEQLEKL